MAKSRRGGKIKQNKPLILGKIKFKMGYRTMMFAKRAEADIRN